MSSISLTPIPLSLPGTSLSPSNFRYNVALVGATDGVNCTFTLPNGWKYVQNLGISIQVLVNAVRQVGSAFVPTELNGLGTGYNAVVFTAPPAVGTTITADFVSL